MTEIGRQYHYHAFISYSHNPDQQLARRLRQRLRSVATHWWERGRMRVFLDEATLIPGDGLDDRLAHALERSAAFILLASPECAASPWVRMEVEHWRNLGRGEILIARTGGDIIWPHGAPDFDWDRTRALSADVFRGAFATEPAWVDLTSAGHRSRRRVSAGAMERSRPPCLTSNRSRYCAASAVACTSGWQQQ